jgi:hypothetical protein
MRKPLGSLAFFIITGIAVGALAAQSPPAPAEIWQSATYHGGSDYEFAETFVVDPLGNGYLLGRTFSADMHGSVPVTPNGGLPGSATFVLKLTPQGVTEYATAVGTGFAFLPLDLAVGADGAAHALARAGDITHIVKLDAVTGALEYDVTFDGQARTALFPKTIAVTDAGHAVIAGWSPGGLFIARLDARGSVFALNVLPLNLDPRDIDVDSAGDVYVIGSMSFDGLPTTAGALQPRFSGGDCAALFPPMGGVARVSPCADAFLLKVTAGGTIAYATYFGGTGLDEGYRVAVDRTGAAVIAGLTRSFDLPTALAVQPQCKPGFAPLPCGDAFVAKIDPTGSALVFATYFGGTDTEFVNGLAIDDEGTVYVGGNLSGGGLPVYRAPQPVSAGGRTEGFAAAFGTAGDLRWSTYVGGPDDDRVVGIGAAAGLIQFGGETLSSAWATGGAPFRGARDLFSARLIDVSAR